MLNHTPGSKPEALLVEASHWPQYRRFLTAQGARTRRLQLTSIVCFGWLLLAASGLEAQSENIGETQAGDVVAPSASAVAQVKLEWEALPALGEDWLSYNQPVGPFRMLGNLFYVGASSVTSFLLTSADGHILIDGGFEQTAPMIAANIKKLGFRLEDVRWLLNSHGHFDHAGGLSSLQRASGAKLAASALETDLLERGGKQDDVFGDHLSFPPVSVDRQLADGEALEFGGMKLTAHVTGGHTRGCTSWEFEVVHRRKPFRVVSICSLSVLEQMRLTGDPSYPGIKEDFESSFASLEALQADVFLASHAGFFGLEAKKAALDVLPNQSVPSANPFVDPEGYKEYLAKARARFEAKLAGEAAPVDGSLE